MAFEEIKESVDDLKNQSEQYINSSVEYVRLWGFKLTAKTGVILMTLFLVGVLLLLSLFFISFAIAFAITNLTGSLTLGFLYVGLGYLVITFIAYFFRKSIVEKPLLRKLSEILFNN